jgi:hypothetical protein
MFRRTLSVVLTGALLGLTGASLASPPAGAVVRCAPGSFDDTEGVVKKVDKTIQKELSHIERAINAAVLNPGDSITRISTIAPGVLAKKTVARSADGNTYSYELDMASDTATPTYVVIATASRTDAGVDANGVHTVNKQITMDYDARGTFIPTMATGNFSATVAHVVDPSKPAPGIQDTLTVSFAGISVRPDDPHGPRTGSYTHIGESAIGGSLDFAASVPDPCPGTATPPIEIMVQRKHVDDATGERTFRRDATVTGGSLSAGQQAIKFVCGDRSTTATGITVTTSQYSLLKIENADGTTQSYKINMKNETGPNCNPVFGAVVSPTDDSTDWPFTHPVTFPGEW